MPAHDAPDALLGQTQWESGVLWESPGVQPPVHPHLIHNQSVFPYFS
jgi:hypothetical protein